MTSDFRERLNRELNLVPRDDDVILVSTIEDLVDTMLAEWCRDRDCLRRWPHRAPGRHVWRHQATPPFDYGRLCFICGHRKGHRVHRGTRA